MRSENNCRKYSNAWIEMTTHHRNEPKRVDGTGIPPALAMQKSAIALPKAPSMLSKLNPRVMADMKKPTDFAALEPESSRHLASKKTHVNGASPQRSLCMRICSRSPGGDGGGKGDGGGGRGKGGGGGGEGGGPGGDGGGEGGASRNQLSPRNQCDSSEAISTGGGGGRAALVSAPASSTNNITTAIPG